MLDYLYQTSDFKLFIILAGFFIFVSLVAIFFFRWLLPAHFRGQQNAVIGYTSALISVVYGVLAGFATLYLINNNNYASDAVQREANAIANIYRESRWLDGPVKAQVQTNIKQYISQVLNVEWPLMNKGATVSNQGDFILEAISNDLSHYKIHTASDQQLLSDMLLVSRNLYDARHQRIQFSYESLSNEVWYVILVGTVLMLFVNYLFGVNLYLHVFAVTAAALMTSSIIFLLISLDKPFQGDFIVGPGVYKSVLMYINHS